MSEQVPIYAPIYASMADTQPLYADINSLSNPSTTANGRDDVLPSIENKSYNSTGASSTGTSNAGTKVQNATNTVINNASAAADAVKNHPITQNAINGPIATTVKDETYKTGNEFSNLAASRTTPHTQAATGQNLTHYHSFFTTLLSWNNPRASGIAYAAIVLFIFAARYLHILRFAFKLTWMTLGVTVLAEVAGKTILSTGLTSQFRPKKYYTLSKDTLNSLVGDVHELINFFIIETQRIVFVENILISGAVFVASFISYFLIKLVPVWGLSLIGVTLLFLGPLIYKSNKELIDEQLNKAATIAGQQSEQMRRLASEQAARASSTTKQYVGDYSAKAQELIGNARGRSSSPTITKNDTFASKTDSLGSKNSTFDTKSDAFGTKNDAFSTKNDAFGTKNDAFGTKTDAFSTKNDAFGTENTGFPVKNTTFGTENTAFPIIKNESNLDNYKTDDFPAAPKDEFKIPSIGQTAGSLRDEKPLYSQ